ncbi:MAG: hypothetical protein ACOCRX_07380 [Candidatus Woesearchaeota archaeon]
MFKRKIFVNSLKKKRKDLSVKEILKSSIDKNFDKFFSPGLGHFEDFYIRDFGWVVDSLIYLGYEKEVKKTLDFVLKSYVENNRITTSITKKGKVYDFPNYAMDSLPYFIYSINKANYKLSKTEKNFIKSQLDYYYQNITEEGLVDSNKSFSSMADHKVRNSSFYSNCMHYLLTKELKKLNIKPKFKLDYLSDLLKDKFWSGSYYYDDLSGKNYFSSDAQIFPYWVGLDKSPERLKKIIKIINKNDINKPLALSYHKDILFEDYSLFEHILNMFRKTNMPKYHAESIFCYRYETDPIWTLLSINYFQILSMMYERGGDDFFLDQLNIEVDKFKKIIKKYNTLYELYEKDSKPFKSLFYLSEPDMIWGAKILEVIEKYGL